MAALVAAMSFCTSVSAQLTIHINNYVGKQLLQLDTVVYRNELNQSFTVTNFKYYISHISLHDKTGKTYESNGYYLIKEDDADSHTIVLNDVPDGEYTGLKFMIGVDSLHNCSGAQSGALDPEHGMFWAWNTGYIFLKLEGKAATSKSPGHIYEYHIGGYKTPANCMRNADLNLTDNPIMLVKGRAAHIYVGADVLEILKTPNTIDFAVLSSVTDFHQGPTIADNYKDMFRIFGIRYEK